MFYPMPEDEFDEDILEEFANSVLKGKAKPFIKSEKLPKKQGDVIKVVGNTFKKIVEDDSKVCSEIYHQSSKKILKKMDNRCHRCPRDARRGFK
jgi:hypothetical protein